MPEKRADVDVVTYTTAELAARAHASNNCLAMRGSWIQGCHGWTAYAAVLQQEGVIIQTGELFTLAGATTAEPDHKADPAAPPVETVQQQDQPPVGSHHQADAVPHSDVVPADGPVPEIQEHARRKVAERPVPPLKAAPATVAPRTVRAPAKPQAVVPSKADLLARLRPGARSVVSAALSCLNEAGVDTSSIVAQVDKVKPGPGPLELVLQKVDGPAAAAARGVFALLISMGLLDEDEDFDSWLCDAIAERASLVVGAVMGGYSDSLCVRPRPSLVEVLGRDRTHYLEA